MGFAERVELFVRVVEQGSLRGVTETLGVSVSAVSRQLAQLEEELGETLLLRAPTGVRPTPAGAHFLPHARAVAAATRAARAALDPERPPEGELVVSTSVSWGLARLVPRLPRLRAVAPDMKVELRFDDAPSDLIAEGVDVAIRGGMPLPDSHNFVARRLEVVPRVLVASPRLLERSPALRDPDGLRDLPALLPGRDPASRTIALSKGRSRRAVTLDGPFITRTMLARHHAARDGLGLTVLPRFLVEADLAEGALVEVLSGWRLDDATVSALFRVELRDEPRLRAFLGVFAPGE